MPAIPLGQGTFERQDATVLRLVNMLYEPLPANIVDQVSFVQRGGLFPFATCGAGPIRGMLFQDGAVGGSIAYVVSGTTLYSVTPAGVVTSIGAIPGAGLVTMAAIKQVLLVCSPGVGLYSWDGTTLAAVDLPDTFLPSSVAELNSYFLVSRSGSQRFYFSAIGAATFDPLDYAAAENDPDDLVGCFVVEDELWLLGTGSAEPWTPTGDPDQPFVRQNGRVDSENGCASLPSCARLDGSLIFVSSNRQVCRTAAKPVPISDHGVDQDLRTVDLSTLRAWSFKRDGHNLYVLGLPTKTLVYDTTTGKWSEFASYGRARFRGHLGCTLLDGTVLCGDDTTGDLFKVRLSVNTDAGGPMERTWTGVLEVLGPPVRCDSVTLDASAGVAAPDTDPVVLLSVSDDRGRTFTSPRAAKLGREGEYGRLPAWTRLGHMKRPGRVFRFTVTDDVRIQPRRAAYNESLR